MPLKMYQNPEAPTPTKIKHIMAIAAGKGGVGKSSLTVHLATALHLLGHSVGILDADLYGPSLRKMLKEEQFPEQRGERIFPAICYGIRMISMAYFKKEGEALAMRAPIANGLITRFLKQVEWGNLDFLLIDFPPGTGDIQLTLGQQAALSCALMVTTPQEISLMDVRKAAHLFQQLKIPILGIIENMSYYKNPATQELLYLFGKGGGKRLAEELAVPLLAEIPVDSAISATGDLGCPLTKEQPSAQIFLHLAESLISHLKTLKNPAIFIKKIVHPDPFSFSIEWSDNLIQNYHPADVQKKCPCASCNQSTPHLIEDAVRVTRIVNSGRYAVRMEFTSGCSSGIYDFDLLRGIGKQ